MLVTHRPDQSGSDPDDLHRALDDADRLVADLHLVPLRVRGRGVERCGAGANGGDLRGSGLENLLDVPIARAQWLTRSSTNFAANGHTSAYTECLGEAFPYPPLKRFFSWWGQC